MNIKSLKHNFVMYSLRIVSGILFTVLVFPYVAKILGPEKLGKVNFVESIVKYFLLFINLGIPSYGKREIAFVREDKSKRSQIVLELLLILLFTTTVTGIIFFIVINYIPYFYDYKVLFYIFSLKIVLNFVNVEWFYMGIEDQEYITKRAVLFKVLSSIAIFYFLKDREDYLKYAGIVVFSLMGSNVLNFKRLFKYVSFNKKMLSEIQIKNHFSPIIILFSTSLATNIFANLDSVMVRVLINEKALGYYAVAHKIGRMPLLISTAVFAVLYPRLCNLVNKKEYKNYYKLGNQGLDLSLIIAIPATVGMYVIAPEIIEVLAGSEFRESVAVFRVFSLLITVMAFAYFTGNNLVINLKEKVVMKGQAIASVTNVIFNLICIPILGAMGAALGTVLAELIAIIYRLTKGKEVFQNFSLIDRNKMKILVSGIVMGFVVNALNVYFDLNPYIQLLSLIVSGGITYLLTLIILKEENIYNFIKSKAIK